MLDYNFIYAYTDCVTAAEFTTQSGFDGECPDDYVLVSCGSYTTTHTLDDWHIQTGGTGCYIQQDSYVDHYGIGICCQLRQTGGIRFTFMFHIDICLSICYPMEFMEIDKMYIINK